MPKAIASEIPLGDRDWLAETLIHHGTDHEETFTSCHVVLVDGSKAGAQKSDKRRGFFRRVFVPWDFEHEKLIE